MIAPSTLRNAADMVDLIKLISTTSGLKEALAEIGAAQQAVTDQLAETVTRENGIAEKQHACELAKRRADAAEDRAEKKLADANEAIEQQRLMAETNAAKVVTLDERAAEIADAEEDIRVGAAHLDAREAKQTERDIILDAREQALDARTNEMNEREQKLREVMRF